MSCHPEYDQKWKDWEQQQPVANPAGPHHAVNRHWPEFNRLADTAAARGLTLELTTGAHLLGNDDEEKHRRLLGSLRLMIGDTIIGLSTILAGDLDSAARELQRTVT